MNSLIRLKRTTKQSSCRLGYSNWQLHTGRFNIHNIPIVILTPSCLSFQWSVESEMQLFLKTQSSLLLHPSSRSRLHYYSEKLPDPQMLELPQPPNTCTVTSVVMSYTGPPIGILCVTVKDKEQSKKLDQQEHWQRLLLG